MERKINVHPALIAAIALSCLIVGWYFLNPLLFIWFTFLLMLYNRLKQDNLPISTFSLYIIVVFVIGIGAVKLSGASYSWVTLLQSISLALPFIFYYGIENTIPGKIGKFAIILFWFAVQYLFIKQAASHSLFILADAPSIHSGWTRWNIQTGFFGGSLWLLTVNFFIYKTFSVQERTNWFALTLAIVCIVLPIYLSAKMVSIPVQPDDMINLYQDNVGNEGYSNIGEVIPRTASWISVLIIIFTLVKIKTKKTQ